MHREDAVTAAVTALMVDMSLRFWVDTLIPYFKLWPHVFTVTPEKICSGIRAPLPRWRHNTPTNADRSF